MKTTEWFSDKAPDGVSTDKLRADIGVLAADMEALLKATASQTSQQIVQVRTEAEATLHAARARIAELQRAALAKTRKAGHVTDAYVHANPWPMMAVCAATGLAFGALLARKADSHL
jgi:ElaB/YqjD/DUF883 family membrane-anchored ribosome-binding protein